MRALHRLPGAAAGVSAQAHVRGGELNETAVVLNGQRLLDPFHIRDYQSMFSAIDARAIDGMEVYTGGFPVRYGDSMGALVLVDALDPHEPRHSELGLSVLNTSALSAGTIGDGTGSWLVSARRSNLEDVVHERLGEPSYYDFFGELGVNFSAAHTGFGECADGTRSRAPRHRSRSHRARAIGQRHAQQHVLGALAAAVVERARELDDVLEQRLPQHAHARQTNDPEKIVATVSDRRDVVDRRRASGLAARRSATRTRCRSAPSINGSAPTTTIPPLPITSASS